MSSKHLNQLTGEALKAKLYDAIIYYKALNYPDSFSVRSKIKQDKECLLSFDTVLDIISEVTGFEKEKIGGKETHKNRNIRRWAMFVFDLYCSDSIESRKEATTFLRCFNSTLVNTTFYWFYGSKPTSFEEANKRDPQLIEILYRCELKSKKSLLKHIYELSAKIQTRDLNLIEIPIGEFFKQDQRFLTNLRQVFYN